MKTRSVVPSEQAIADIQQISTWLTNEASAAVARRYVGRIRQRLASLTQASERGTIRSDIRSGLRVIGILGSATVAFQVTETTVRVLRVLHGGQDWQSVLTALDDPD